MRIVCWLWLVSQISLAAPKFVALHPNELANYQIHTKELCLTAQNTLSYLNKGSEYDPQVIHGGKILPIPLERVKKTLVFVCNNQSKLNDPQFIKQHFEFIRWYPDTSKAKKLSKGKPLLQHLPTDKVLMTKYFVHLAKASTKPSSLRPYALYALPADEANLSLEAANAIPNLTRFKYGKHAILKGALNHKPVKALAYLTRDDLETTLLQGTVVADFGPPIGKKIFNVHRNNNIAYDRSKGPYEQERYWYFKEVDGIKGYGKDAEHKITVYPEVTFAGDLNEFGLGRLLFIQYKNNTGQTQSKMGILADTGGAFDFNLYQIDYLAGSFSGKEGLYKATRSLPDYVEAYFMLVKEN
ncbi:hypothetical protein Lwal_2366 [Legionella waltersii]|uniref:Lytic transglycosylase MltA domain-containing protein n=2 Tax=Legionella waltersii TaxID=66969 RepID=A0A0W1A5N9_9GAMM|nr:hypothetical protein Lwal_2366 [Legionella waltersii]SNU94767.1 Uncharacterised protein [Legionella waltersii]